MPTITERLGSGWVVLDSLPASSSEPDTLQLRIYAATAYSPGIYVPRSIDRQVGELVAIVLRTGEKISLGEGAIVAHNKGIRILDPYDMRRSKLRTNLIVDLDEMVSLRFTTQK